MRKLDFALVSTVYNEASNLEGFIADIESQILKPDEIIVVDAGSKDGTYERLLKWKSESAVPISIIQKVRCNVAEGRNLAIRDAKYDLIASADFGCRFKPQWLEFLMKPFNDPTVKVVWGGFEIAEEEITTLAAKADYLLCGGYKFEAHPRLTPTSRSIAYRKNVWEQVGGYPEWLTLAGDDTIFGLKLKALGIPVAVAPDPNVLWTRHKSIKGFAQEAFRYGLGDGESGINLRNFISNFIETGLRYSLFLGIPIYLTGIIPLPVLIPLLLFQTLGLRSYRNAFVNWMRLRSSKYNFKVFLYGLLLIEASRVYYLYGNIKGRICRNSAQKAGAKELRIFLKTKCERWKN